MIEVNGRAINFTKFPDGTSSFRFDPGAIDNFVIWKYDGDQECILLYYLVKHIRSICGDSPYVVLVVPYIPNARMDRVKNDDEVFTLKWFAEFINDLKFDRVLVTDPHSDVSTALIDRVFATDIYTLIHEVTLPLLKDKGFDDILFCYPDEGAMKRYSAYLKGEFVFGVKHRHWRTGKIERLELVGEGKVAGRDVLIIDDICSKGGTFTHTATALKDAGAKNIFLFVAHCENTIFKGSVLTDSLIRHVFTTDSIYRGESDMITVANSQVELNE